MNHNLDIKKQKLQQILAQKKDWLFRFAYMRIGNREDAEDVIQDVFLKFFQAIDKLDHVEEMDKYLTRSISNSCKDYLRRRTYNTVLIDDVNVPCDEDDNSLHEEYVRIQRLLQALPSEQSEVIRLKCHDNLTFKEIADIEDIPEATAKSRYRYGIMSIQKSLQREGGTL